MSDEDDWDDVRERVGRFDLENTISTAIKLVGEGNYWEPIDNPKDEQSVIRNHFSHTLGDSGIPNMMHRVDEPEKVVLEKAKNILSMDFRDLVQTSISKEYYTKQADVYHWGRFFHTGSGLEAIHLAILLDGDEELRQKWSGVLSSAFMLAEKLANQL